MLVVYEFKQDRIIRLNVPAKLYKRVMKRLTNNKRVIILSPTHTNKLSKGAYYGYI